MVCWSLGRATAWRRATSVAKNIRHLERNVDEDVRYRKWLNMRLCELWPLEPPA